MASYTMLLLWSPRYTLQSVKYHTHHLWHILRHKASGSSHLLVDTKMASMGLSFPSGDLAFTIPSPFSLSSFTTEVTPLEPFLFRLCKHSLSRPVLQSLLQLSPSYHEKSSLLASFSFFNSGVNPKPLSQTDSSKCSANDTPSERQRKTFIF